MSYISITPEQQKQMLKEIGVQSVEELYHDIPDSILLKNAPDIPGSESELHLVQELSSIADNNRAVTGFVGAGAYNHYIPAVVDHLASRSEFYSAYTPYQAEVSQGTLTAIYEFQTMICTLTAMDVANAGMYDGATSLAESLLMSKRNNKKNRFLISGSIHPHYMDVIKTYAWASGLELIVVEPVNGIIPVTQLSASLDDTISAVVIQNPNFFGCIENIDEISATIQNSCNLIVTVTESLSMALLKQPGLQGADIVCGEAQSFGNPVASGGPMLGFIAAKQPFTRLIPGRLVGKTTDSNGDEAYVLTLQTREQHIRRERATSNICTNEGLCTLRATIYLSIMGNKLRELARLNHQTACYFKEKLAGLGLALLYQQPFFNEFVINGPGLNKIYSKLLTKNIQLGIPLNSYYPQLDNSLLINATELHDINTIDHVTSEIKQLLK